MKIFEERLIGMLNSMEEVYESDRPFGGINVSVDRIYSSESEEIPDYTQNDILLQIVETRHVQSVKTESFGFAIVLVFNNVYEEAKAEFSRFLAMDLSEEFFHYTFQTDTQIYELVLNTNKNQAVEFTMDILEAVYLVNPEAVDLSSLN